MSFVLVEVARNTRQVVTKTDRIYVYSTRKPRGKPPLAGGNRDGMCVCVIAVVVMVVVVVRLAGGGSSHDLHKATDKTGRLPAHSSVTDGDLPLLGKTGCARQ